MRSDESEIKAIEKSNNRNTFQCVYFHLSICEWYVWVCVSVCVFSWADLSHHDLLIIIIAVVIAFWYDFSQFIYYLYGDFFFISPFCINNIAHKQLSSIFGCVNNDESFHFVLWIGFDNWKNVLILSFLGINALRWSSILLLFMSWESNIKRQQQQIKNNPCWLMNDHMVEMRKWIFIQFD